MTIDRHFVAGIDVLYVMMLVVAGVMVVAALKGWGYVHLACNAFILSLCFWIFTIFAAASIAWSLQ